MGLAPFWSGRAGRGCRLLKGPADEDIPVYRVYFSLTGLPGQWQVIPSLCSVTGRLSATLNLGHWPAGGTLYVLWADDNGPRAASSQLPREGTYTLDNFSAEPGPPFLAVTRLSAGTNQFTWPDFITNYTLISATNLRASAWSPVAEPDIPATGFHRVSVGNSAPARYFRLERQ